MKICIVSDRHDRSDPLAAAILAAQASGTQAVIHCGDLAQMTFEIRTMQQPNGHD